MSEYAHDASDESWRSFQAAVVAAGLMPHKRAPSHWHITGGTRCRLVYCWPNTKKGFRFTAESGPAVRSGTVADAIKLAGAPVKPAEPPWGEETESILQTIREADRPVGLIRRFWRWLW